MGLKVRLSRPWCYLDFIKKRTSIESAALEQSSCSSADPCLYYKTKKGWLITTLVEERSPMNFSRRLSLLVVEVATKSWLTLSPC